jgi:CelD/BcsL family acetyltransferase involved in cellulose biosynthesis
MRLHCARWRDRGQSHIAALGPAFPALLGEVAAAQLDAGRFRLWVLELDGEPICADLSLAAGGEVVGYNAGWDERHRALSPPRLAFLRKIEECFERGDRRLSLGWGMLDYKRSFANSSEAVGWEVLLPVGPGLPRSLVRLGPRLVAGRVGPSLKRNLPAEQVERLRGLRARRRANG